MPYKVQLIYFRQTGKFLSRAEATIAHDQLSQIWQEIDDRRRLGRLPGIRPGAGRDLFVIVDVPDHPQRVLHLVVPSWLDEDDVTPPHVSTEEMIPLMREPFDEIARTSTRDIVKIDLDADVEADTVVVVPDRPIPKRTEEE